MVATPYAFSVLISVCRPVDFAQGRSSVTIINNGTETIFLGYDESLTIGNGLPMKAGQAFVFSRDFSDDPELAIYAISTSTTNDIRVLEAFGISLVDILMKK